MITLIIGAIAVTLALVSAILIVNEKDVLKAIVLAGVESVFFAIALAIFLAPDLLIAYIAIGLGLNSLLFIYALKRGERYEEE